MYVPVYVGTASRSYLKWTQHLTSATIFDNYSDSDSGEDNISEPETQADINENLQLTLNLKQATQGKNVMKLF